MGTVRGGAVEAALALGAAEVACDTEKEAHAAAKKAAQLEQEERRKAASSGTQAAGQSDRSGGDSSRRNIGGSEPAAGGTARPASRADAGAGVPLTKAVKPCARCGTTSVQTHKCAGCKGPYYCGRECQKADWKAGHKAACQAAVAK